MRNTEKKNMQRKLDELKRITGLSLSIDLPDTTDRWRKRPKKPFPIFIISLIL